MGSSFEMWKRNLWIWLLPAVFLAINLILLVIYQTSFASRRTSLENISGRAGLRLEGLKAHHAELERFLVQVDQQKQAINSIYEDHFATEAQRFTELLRDVRKLARQAGLAPDTFSYPKVELQTEGLVSRKVNFAVDGTYEQLRRLINFLELSDQFITLDDIKLSGDSGSDRLLIRLSLSTLFVATDEDKMIKNALESIGQSQEVDMEQADPQASDGNEAGGDEAGGDEAGGDDLGGDGLEEEK